MIIKTIKVSDKGQITIPQKMRKEAGIKKGEELIIIQDKGTILLEKAQKTAMKIKKKIYRFKKSRKKYEDKYPDLIPRDEPVMGLRRAKLITERKARKAKKKG